MAGSSWRLLKRASTPTSTSTSTSTEWRGPAADRELLLGDGSEASGGSSTRTASSDPRRPRRWGAAGCHSGEGKGRNEHATPRSPARCSPGVPQPGGHGYGDLEASGLVASWGAAGAGADCWPAPPATTGRCVAVSVTLAAVTLAVSLVAATRRGGAFGMQFGQLSRAVSGQEALLEDGRSSRDHERALLIFQNVAPKLAASNWQVPPDTYPQTLAFPSDAAHAMGSLQQCQVVAGTAQNLTDGRMWIKLDQDTGGRDRWVSLDRFKLQKVAFALSKPGQMCHEQPGLFPIALMSHCKMAALDMGFHRVVSTWESTWPEGCNVLNQSAVVLNTNPHSSGNDTGKITRLACSSLEPCVPITSTVTSTTTATTTATKRFDGLSLFCFVVAEAQSFEPDLLRFARSQKTGAYGCEEHMTLTDHEIDVGTRDDPEMTTAIGSFESDMGGWGSWSNAGVFLKAWRAVMRDGRFRKHDWTVKLDADAVFFRGRLIGHVAQMADHGQGTPSDLMFLENFVDGYPLVGAVEVVSNAAILALEQRIGECEAVAYGAEDSWFAGCMKVLGARGQRDIELLQHDQNWLGCHDERIVTMHPYKTVEEYQKCFDEASQ